MVSWPHDIQAVSLDAKYPIFDFCNVLLVAGKFQLKIVRETAIEVASL